MKVSFEYTENDYKKFLLKSRKINNIVLLILGVSIYLFFTIKVVSLLYLPLFIIGLIVVIYLLNRLYVLLQLKVNNMLNNNIIGKYVIELTNNKYSITINNKKTDYKYKNIKKIKVHKNSFDVKTNNFRESFIFEKNKLNDNYDKLLSMFKEKVTK